MAGTGRDHAEAGDMCQLDGSSADPTTGTQTRMIAARASGRRMSTPSSMSSAASGRPGTSSFSPSAAPSPAWQAFPISDGSNPIPTRRQFAVAAGGLHRFPGPAGRGRLRTMGEELAKLVVNGNIKPMLAETVEFERLPDALAQPKWALSAARWWLTCATRITDFNRTARGTSGNAQAEELPGSWSPMERGRAGSGAFQTGVSRDSRSRLRRGPRPRARSEGDRRAQLQHGGRRHRIEPRHDYHKSVKHKFSAELAQLWMRGASAGSRPWSWSRPGAASASFEACSPKA